MTVEQAFEKAKEQGYFDTMNGEPIEEYPEIAFLNPSFWQALGKARGWITPSPFVRWYCKYDGCNDGTETLDEFKAEHPDDYDDLMSGKHVELENNRYQLITPNPQWKARALEYFEVCLSGGDEKGFWQSLP